MIWLGNYSWIEANALTYGKRTLRRECDSVDEKKKTKTSTESVNISSEFPELISILSPGQSLGSMYRPKINNTEYITPPLSDCRHTSRLFSSQIELSGITPRRSAARDGLTR